MPRKIKLRALLFRRHYWARYHKLHRDPQPDDRRCDDRRREDRRDGPNLLKRLSNKFRNLSSVSRIASSAISPSSPRNPIQAIKAIKKKIQHYAAIPQGSCAVYVGPEHKRFLLKTRYLEHPAIGVLLQRSREEFGYDYSGGLLIPCPVAVFEYLLRLLKRNDPRVGSDVVKELIQRSC